MMDILRVSCLSQLIFVPLLLKFVQQLLHHFLIFHKHAGAAILPTTIYVLVEKEYVHVEWK